MGEYDCVNSDWVWQQIPSGIGEGILEHISLDTSDLDNDSSTTDYRQYLTAMDYQQSFCCLGDVNGNGVEVYDYLGPYGESDTKDGSGTSIGNYASRVHSWKRMHGGTVVEDLAIYDFRNRWLNPVTGSWMSRDPLGLVDSPNLYQGMLGSPTLFRDPSGLSTETIAKPAPDSSGQRSGGTTTISPGQPWRPKWGFSKVYSQAWGSLGCRNVPVGFWGYIGGFVFAYDWEIRKNGADWFGYHDWKRHCFYLCAELTYAITYWCTGETEYPWSELKITTFSLEGQDEAKNVPGTGTPIPKGPGGIHGEVKRDWADDLGFMKRGEVTWYPLLNSGEMCKGLEARYPEGGPEIFEPPFGWKYYVRGPNSNSWARDPLYPDGPTPEFRPEDLEDIQTVSGWGFPYVR